MNEHVAMCEAALASAKKNAKNAHNLFGQSCVLGAFNAAYSLLMACAAWKGLGDSYLIGAVAGFVGVIGQAYFAGRHQGFVYFWRTRIAWWEESIERAQREAVFFASYRELPSAIVN